MGGRLPVRRTTVLEHVLDEVDAAARAVEFVAEHDVGRAGRGAEAAVHAGAQNLLRFGDMRVSELVGGKIRLHAPAILPPRRRRRSR